MNELTKEYTVSEIVKSIKDTLESKYFYVKIKGEVTGFKKHPSGHLYFSLKDENSMINVVMFKSFADFCKIDIDNGMEIIVAGKLTIYKERSNYQLLAETMQISGVGTLLKIIQERKEKLAKEGLFDVSRKKAIPRLPKSVGIITAESGAAIHDILSRLSGRTPISIILYSSLMQGKDAPLEIIKAIKYFNSLPKQERPQVLVVTRGGGSMEDLMAFNDENLVRTVANSEIPTISAVGHEIDWTLIDYASDLRLPTPTSVAEYLTISKEEAYGELNSLITKLYLTLANNNKNKFQKLNTTFLGLIKFRLEKYQKNKYCLQTFFVKINNFFRIIVARYKHKKFFLEKIDLNKIIRNKLNLIKQKLNLFNLKLENYVNKYPIFKDTMGQPIKFKSNIMLGKNYIVEFPDGNVKVKIVKI